MKRNANEVMKLCVNNIDYERRRFFGLFKSCAHRVKQTKINIYAIRILLLYFTFFKVTTYFPQQLLRDFEYVCTFCLFFHCLPITLNVLLMIGRSVEMITALRDKAAHA